MNSLNTSKIGTLLLTNGLDYLPEAHCYLLINNRRIDITNRNSDFENIKNEILQEIEIEPEQVSTFKMDYHRNYLKKWIDDNNIALSFDKVWEIREKCIAKLEA
jgi:hypothetical protein